MELGKDLLKGEPSYFLAGMNEKFKFYRRSCSAFVGVYPSINTCAWSLRVSSVFSKVNKSFYSD